MQTYLSPAYYNSGGGISLSKSFEQCAYNFNKLFNPTEVLRAHSAETSPALNGRVSFAPSKAKILLAALLLFIPIVNMIALLILCHIDQPALKAKQKAEMETKVAKQKAEKQTQAATTIQKAFRSFSAKKTAKMMVASLQELKSLMRVEEQELAAKQKAEEQNQAATTIQRAFRNFKAKKTAKMVVASLQDLKSLMSVEEQEYRAKELDSAQTKARAPTLETLAIKTLAIKPVEILINNVTGLKTSQAISCALNARTAVSAFRHGKFKVGLWFFYQATGNAVNAGIKLVPGFSELQAFDRQMGN